MLLKKKKKKKESYRDLIWTLRADRENDFGRSWPGGEEEKVFPSCLYAAAKCIVISRWLYANRR